MNRSIVGVGVGIVLVAVALFAWPVVTAGPGGLTPPNEAGMGLLPIGIAVVVLGCLATDPSVTTVAGLFGNPVENELRSRRPAGPPRRRAVTLQDPREPVHCRACYTMVPAALVDCPRCGKPRACRGCGGPMESGAPTASCAACSAFDVYCQCPPVRGIQAPAIGGRVRA